MFCPNDECPDFINNGLRSEYRDDIMVCPFCGTNLVAVLAESSDEGAVGLPVKPKIADDEVMEPVIEATDLSEVAVIRSILDGAAIPFITIGEDRFNAFRGVFAGASIFNPSARGVVFSVPSRMADEARALLEELVETTDDT
jgi:hypothetical protein